MEQEEVAGCDAAARRATMRCILGGLESLWAFWPANVRSRARECDLLCRRSARHALVSFLFFFHGPLLVLWPSSASFFLLMRVLTALPPGDHHVWDVVLVDAMK